MPDAARVAVERSKADRRHQQQLKNEETSMPIITAKSPGEDVLSTVTTTLDFISSMNQNIDGHSVDWTPKLLSDGLRLENRPGKLHS